MAVKHNVGAQLRTVIALPTSHQNVVVYVAIDGPPGPPQAVNAIAVDAVARSLIIDRQPVFSPITQGNHMTWGAFIDSYDQGLIDPDQAQGFLGNANSISDIEIILPAFRDESYLRPDWATHVVWIG